MAYLVSHGQQEVVEEDGGGGKLIILPWRLAQSVRDDENDAHVDRVPGG